MPDAPHLIQNPSDELRALLTAFGVVTPPGLWFLHHTVQPVSIIDSRVDLTAVATPPVWDVRASNGEINNPVAGAELLDTGQLVAGNYFFEINAAMLGQERLRFALRNAADAADVYSDMIQNGGAGANSFYGTWIVKVATNERVVVRTVTAVTGLAQAVAYYRLLT